MPSYSPDLLSLSQPPKQVYLHLTDASPDSHNLATNLLQTSGVEVCSETTEALIEDSEQGFSQESMQQSRQQSSQESKQDLRQVFIKDNLSESIEITAFVDGRGLACPMPLLKTKVALRSVQTGKSLYVIATDANSQHDITAFAKHTQLSCYSWHNQAKQEKQEGHNRELYHFILLP